MLSLLYLIPTLWFGDAAVAYQLGFQDPATTTMEGTYLFNLYLLFVIISIVIVVGWLLFSVLTNFTELDNSDVATFVHSNSVEIIWTTIPALILLSLASPSFSLLYSLDEISNPELTLKILGHQWYWAYEISDFNPNMLLLSYLRPTLWLNDADIPYQLVFQDPSTTAMESICLFNLHLLFVIIGIVFIICWLLFSVLISLIEGDKNDLVIFVFRHVLFLQSSQNSLFFVYLFISILYFVFNNIDITMCTPEESFDIPKMEELLIAHEGDLNLIKDNLKTIQESITQIADQGDLSKASSRAGMSSFEFKKIINKLMEEHKTAVDKKISNLVQETSSVDSKIIKAQADANHAIKMSYLAIGFSMVAILFMAVRK